MKKKIVSDICLRCGRERKSKEKSFGCFHWHKFISDRHLYTYYENQYRGFKIVVDDDIKSFKLITQ